MELIDTVADADKPTWGQASVRGELDRAGEFAPV